MRQRLSIRHVPSRRENVVNARKAWHQPLQQEDRESNERAHEGTVHHGITRVRNPWAETISRSDHVR
jgi:hypothetical protein